jgi:branched-chain amino acid transport system permease protein
LSIVPAKPFDGSKDVVDGLGLLEWREGRRPEVSGALAFTAIVQLALVHSDVLTGGAAGMAMPEFQIFGVTLSKGGELYYLVLPVTVMLFRVTGNVMRSRFGRGLAARRQSETAAAAMGLNMRRYKAAAFAGSGFLGAIGGATLALLSTYLDPVQFGITQSIYYLAIAVVGGMLSPVGIIVASAIFVFTPEWLQAFQSYLGLVLALFLLGFIVLRPDGLCTILADQVSGVDGDKANANLDIAYTTNLY